ncbi:MAG: transporter substrate-binding domain-containing protein [Candidatus Thiodiazotropha sp. (ex Myrtea spinifera)]|nr:transporter substrate-binding domain-containing protein [Candidatus Thiodiazotropha sp. (ex Myrtea spinifera)]
MWKRQYSIYLIFCLSLSWTLANSAQISRYNVAEKAWLDSHQVLRVGVVEQTPPILFYAGGSHPKGLVADYLRALAMHLGLQLEIIQFSDQSSLASALRGAEVDAVGTAVAGGDRRKQWLYTRPYLSLSVGLFGNQQIPSGGLKGLGGKAVAVVRGGVWEKVLTSMAPGVIPVPFPTIEAALRSVAEGGAFAYLGDTASVTQLLQQVEIDDIEEQQRLNLTFDISLATLEQQPELQSLIQKGVDRIGNEELQAIWHRWPRVERPENYKEQIPTWLILTPLALVWTVFVGWVVRRHTAQQQTHRHGRLKQAIRRLQKREKHLKEKLLRLKRKTLSYRKASRFHRQRLGLLEHVMPNAAWVWDSSMTQCQWDDGMYGFFQVDSGEFEPTPESILDCVHSEDRDRVAVLFSTQDENSELQLSYRVVLPDGQIRWLLDYSHYSDENVEEGVPQRVGICWDISDYLGVTEGQDVQRSAES